MVSDGADGGFLKNHVVINNRFAGYDKAVIVGTGSAEAFDSGHIVWGNKIAGCGADGITVKCGYVRVIKNIISGCVGSGIVVAGGYDTTVEGNRVSDCDIGITAGGLGHTVAGNYIAGCKSSAVSARGDGADIPMAQNLLVHENRFSGCGTAVDTGEAGVVISDNADGADLDDFIDEDVVTDESYVEASMLYDDSDYDDDADSNYADADDGDDDDGQDSMIKYMFNPEG
jgi:parallel beta-helix repeat protein